MEQLRERLGRLLESRCTYCGWSVSADEIVLPTKKGVVPTRLVDCPRCGAEMEPRIGGVPSNWVEPFDLGDEAADRDERLRRLIDRGSGSEFVDRALKRYIDMLGSRSPTDFEVPVARVELGLNRPHATDALDTSDIDVERNANPVETRHSSEESLHELSGGVRTERVRWRILARRLLGFLRRVGGAGRPRRS